MSEGRQKASVKGKQMNMKKHRLPAVCAGIFASVTSAFAAVRTLPTPGPSGYGL